jgi:hypothetical protein
MTEGGAIFHYMDHTVFIHSSAGVYIGYNLVIVNTASMNMEV